MNFISPQVYITMDNHSSDKPHYLKQIVYMYIIGMLTMLSVNINNEDPLYVVQVTYIHS